MHNLNIVLVVVGLTIGIISVGINVADAIRYNRTRRGLSYKWMQRGAALRSVWYRQSVRIVGIFMAVSANVARFMGGMSAARWVGGLICLFVWLPTIVMHVRRRSVRFA